MIQKHADLQVPNSQGKELSSAIQVKVIKSLLLYLLAYIQACAPGISPFVMATCTGAAM